ncbi:AHNK protein, partial [Amia calva]|nr:AHNK protein [Amia calva]
IETMEGSDVIVNTEKEACAKGLVVSGGGKDGIFVKEVMKESSASKRLSLIEGDQILSATVFFDDVKYEDALQILEHAKPYKVQFCLKRHSSMTSEGSLTSLQESEKATMERGRSKTPRRQEARISWPKFPSFTRGRKMQFKRSHSTSEAEEQKKLDMSPTSSDTESPTKGQEPLKTKMKKPKLKLSNLGIKDLSIQSTDQHTTETVAEKSEHLEVIEKSPMKDESMVLSSKHPLRKEQETPEICAFESDENVDTTKIQNECLLPNVTGPEVEISQHKAELISLDKTLKTTDISIYGPKTDDILVEPGAERSRPKRTPEGKRRKKKQRSELKVNIKGKEKGDLSPDHQATSPQTLILIPSPHSLGPEVQFELQTTEPGGKTTEQLPLGDAPISPNVVSHAELKGRQLAIDINTQRVGSNRSSIKVDVMKPKVDVMSTKQTMKTEDGQKEGSDGRTRSKQNGNQRPIPGNGHARETYLETKADVSSLPPVVAIKSPEMKSEPDLPQSEGKIDVKGYGVDVQAPKIRGELDADDTIGSIEKFKLPQFKVPKMDLSSLDEHEHITMTDVNAAKAKPDIVKAEIKAPKMDVNIQSTDADSGEIKGPKGKSDMPKLEMAEVDVQLPKVKPHKFGLKKPKSETGLYFSKPEMQIQGVNIDAQIRSIKSPADIPETQMESVKGKFKKPEIKIPSVGLLSGEYETTITKTDISHPKANIDMDVNLAKPKPDIATDSSIPEFKLPNIDLSDLVSDDVHKPITMTQVDVSSSNVKAEMKALPKVKGPEIDIQMPKADTDITLTKPQLDIKGPDVEIKAPSLEASAELPDIAAKGGKGKFHMPHIKMPSFGISTPDVKGQKPALELKGPSVDIGGPALDVDMKGKGVEVEGEGGKFKLPKFGISLPKVDIQTQKPDVDISLPQAKLEGQLSTVELEGPSVEGGVDVKGPQVDIQGAKIKGDVKEIDIEGSPTKFKMPSFKMPKFGFSSGKVKAEAPEISADISVPEIEVPSGKAGIDIKSPDIDIQGPRVAIEKPDSKIELPKVKMPDIDIKLPKVKGPEIDIQMPKADTDITLTKPELDIKGPDVEIKAPSLEASAELPDIAAKGGKGKFHMPHIKMPSFGISTPDVKEISGPAVDVKLSKPELTVSGQKPALELKGPSVDIGGPALDVDMKGKGVEVEGEGGKFKLPKFGISLPKVDIQTQKPDVDISLPQAKLEGQLPTVELEGPSVEGKLEMPDIDAKGIDVKLKKPKISMPKFGMSKPEVKGPEAEIDVTLPKGDISLPEGGVDVKGPQVDIQGAKIKGDVKEIDIEGSPTKFKMPSFKMPKFGFSSGKVKAEAPEISADISVPEIEVPSGKAGIDIKSPDIDIQGPRVAIEKPDSKIELPKVKMPDIDIKLPKVKGPEIDIQMPKADTDITLTKPELDIKGPDVEIKAPSLEASAELPDIAAKGGKGKFHMPHIKMPSFGISTPDVKGQKPALELKGPSVDIGGPALDVDMKGKGVEVEGEGGKFKLPKFGISLPKVDIQTQKPDVDISLPQAKLEGQLPTVELEGPSVEGKLEMPDIDAKGIDVKLKKPKISMSKFGMSKPEVKGPEAEVDVTLPKGDISLPEGGVDVKGPQVDIKGHKIKGDVKDIDIESSPTKFKMPSFKMPKFGFSSPKVKAEAPEISADISVSEIEVPSGKAGIDIKSPDIDIQGPRVAIEKPDSKIELPKVKMPDIDIKLPQVKGTESDIKMQATTDISISKPEAESLDHDIDIKGSPNKFRFPTFTMPKFGISTSNTKSPDTEVSGKVVNLDRSGAEIGVEGPSLEIERPDIQSSDISLKKSSGFSISFPKLKSPEINISAENEGKSGKDLLSMPSHSIDGKSEGGISSSLRYPETKSSQADKGPRVESEGSRKTSRINLPSFGDILKGLDIEFHVPTLEDEEILASSKEDPSQSGVTEQGNEASDMSVAGKKLTSGVQLTEPSSSRPSMGVEGSLETKETESTQTKEKSGKFRFRFPKLGFSDSSQESSKTESTNLVMEAKEKPPPSPEKKLSTEKKETATKSDKGGWFKFPKLGISSPTKSTKDSQKEITQLSEDLEESTEGGPVEGEVSLMSSLKSSDAFADISSSEPIPSPTKVTVKFSEPAVRVAGGEMKSPAGIITSTARTELILLEPCLPEKMHTPTDPASVGAISPPEETSKQPAAHTQGTRNVQVVTSEKHGVTSTQSTTVITKMETSSVHALPVQKVTVKASSVPWTTEESAKGFPEPAGKHISVERHVVKEKSGDEKEKVVITRRVQSHQFEVASGESLAEGTASAIKRLKDTMHSEKLKFFESTEMSSASGSSHPSEKEESDKGAPPEKK